MPVMDITNPATIKFLVENYNKTALMRSKWNELHKERLAKAATFKHEKGYRESDVAAVTMRAGLAAITRDYASGAINRLKVFYDRAPLGISSLRKGHSIVDIGYGDPETDPRLARPDTDLQIDPKMRPVDPEQKAILYKTKPVFGRKVYLKARARMLPEDKFYFPQTSAWEHGWRMKDSSCAIPLPPKFGHVCKF